MPWANNFAPERLASSRVFSLNDLRNVAASKTCMATMSRDIPDGTARPVTARRIFLLCQAQKVAMLASADRKCSLSTAINQDDGKGSFSGCLHAPRTSAPTKNNFPSTPSIASASLLIWLKKSCGTNIDVSVSRLTPTHARLRSYTGCHNPIADINATEGFRRLKREVNIPLVKCLFPCSCGVG